MSCVFNLFRLAACLVLAVCCTQCSSTKSSSGAQRVIVSVRDQKLGVYEAGKLVKTYKVSTSKFGLGDRPGSNCTPLGRHEVVAKIGHGLPKGAVLKSRHWNGEVVKPNAPGRDPIVSRILWLSGTEGQNKNAYGRCIYIHGTAEEKRLGVPASYGCVRMSARDIIDVFNKVGIGATVDITTNDLPRRSQNEVGSPIPTSSPASAAPLPLPRAIPVQVDSHGRMIVKENQRIGPPTPRKAA
ncbi:MAG: L,D-transpeptidase [Verrucomicrobiaceae bacterium]|nr:L,D-transpeptidase [Verrucomicrobiaceae bacterium]